MDWIGRIETKNVKENTKLIRIFLIITCRIKNVKDKTKIKNITLKIAFV